VTGFGADRGRHAEDDTHERGRRGAVDGCLPISRLPRAPRGGGRGHRPGIIDRIDADIDMDGMAYHDRGIRAPGYDATFVPEPEGSRVLRRSASRSTLSAHGASGGIRRDALLGFLPPPGGRHRSHRLGERRGVQRRGSGAVHVEHDALAAGRFSFGTFIYADEEWEEQRELIEGTDAPAFLQRDDGSTLVPTSQSDFYDVANSTPEDFRTNGGGAPPTSACSNSRSRSTDDLRPPQPTVHGNRGPRSARPRPSHKRQCVPDRKRFRGGGEPNPYVTAR